jgi:rhamnosyltransferase
MIKVSVIIPTYNGGDILLAVLAMVCSQEVDFRYSIVIIDSGSTDGTLSHLKRIDAENENVILRQIPKAEFGHGKTRNLGASLTNSEYIAYITQDALPTDRNWLKELIEPLENDEMVAGVFGKHRPYASAGILLSNDLNNFMAGFDSGPDIVYLDDPDRYNNDLGYKQFLHFYSDNNSCMRRSVWKKIPYRDVEYGEDQIWARDIIEAGYKKGYASKAEVYHSHNYGIRETYQRALVDRQFWLKYFDYKGINNIFLLFKETKNLSLSQIDYLKNKNIKNSFLEKINIFLINFARFYGEYKAHSEYKSEK